VCCKAQNGERVAHWAVSASQSFARLVLLLIDYGLDIIKNRFASTIIAHNDRDFWYEAKKVCDTKHKPVRTVDGFTQQDDIANLSARSYEDLLSRVGINESELAGLKVDIDALSHMMDSKTIAKSKLRMPSRLFLN
jgi:hypothetical protein